MYSTTAFPEDIINNSNRAKGKLFGLKKLPYKVPFIGAGGIYSCSEDLVKFVQFHLNKGRVNGIQLLDSKYLYEMYTPFIVKNYGLGINVSFNDGFYTLFHNGSGYGFGSSMKWFPEYGIGCIALGNYQIECVLENYVSRVLKNYITESDLQKISVGYKPPKELKIDKTENTVNCIIVCYVPTNETSKTEIVKIEWKQIKYKKEWKKYIDTYKIKMDGGFKFKWFAKIAMIFKIYPKVKVYKKRDYLYLRENPMGTRYINDLQLYEYKTGLFFTSEGEALDFRDEVKTYRNLKLK